MGKPKAPKAPDPKETAAAQTGTNVSTAIANANLGNVNQITPYGNLTYSQTGSAFTPSDTGQDYYWNPKTGEYSTNQKITGYTPASSQSSGSSAPGTLGALFGNKAGGNAGGQPIYEDGWQQVKGMLVPTFTATTTLSPEQQKILDQNNITDLNLASLGAQQSGRLNQLLGNPFTLSGLPAAGDPNTLQVPNYTQYGSGPQLQTSIAGAGDITKSYGTDYASNVQQVQDAMFSRLNPQMDRERANLESSLVNQGIRRGGDAWNNAMSQFDQSINDQRTSVLLAAGQEQSRLAGLARDQATFQNSAQQQQYDQNYNSAGFSNNAAQQMYSNQNTAASGNNALQDSANNAALARFNAQNQTRQNAMNEAFAVRNQGINEVVGLASGAQIQNPNFVNTNMPSIPTTDYAGIVQQNYANQMGAYNSQMANYNGILGGLFGLGASAIKASDRRLKRDVRRIGTYRNGMAKYEFRYLWSDRRHIGLMSDDVRKVRPDAVVSIDGYDAVNYRKALA